MSDRVPDERLTLIEQWASIEYECDDSEQRQWAHDIAAICRELLARRAADKTEVTP